MLNKNPTHLVLADNIPQYRRSLRSFLELEDYTVEEAGSVQEAKAKMGIANIALVLADLRLTSDDDANDISGLDVAKYANERGIPCIIVTAFPSVEATRLALRSRGADPPLALDLIPKSNGPHAILDAIKIALTMHKPQGDFVMDLDKELAWHSGVLLGLSRQQYDLVAHLYSKNGAVCSAEELLKVVYNEDVPLDQASADKRLERLIARTREKIEEDPSKPKHLLTVPGRGFRLERET